MSKHLLIIPLTFFMPLLSFLVVAAGAQPALDCAKVKEFISNVSNKGQGLKGELVKKTQYQGTDYKALKTITPKAAATYNETILADEIGGITTTITYGEDLYTTKTQTDAEQKCQQYINQLKNCGYTDWEPHLKEANRKEYTYIDYTDTGDLYLYLGYQLVDQTDWIIYLDISWTVYK
ncbi:MAG: hypothetical protein POELPBGB_01140 [Bacteroidia bacterium]|nr:hypothetical protein [Bacteroidia bacterium]